MTKNQILVLNRLQKGMPLEDRPFEIISNELGLETKEVIEAIKALKEKGYIRRFGGIVDINLIGIKSILVGMKISKENLNSVSEIINSYKGVTHNYSRNHSFNLWFTLMEKDQESLDESLNKIKTATNPLKMVCLSSRKKYKTKVIFKF